MVKLEDSLDSVGSPHAGERSCDDLGIPAERLDSFLLSLNRYPISDLNKIYQYSRIFYPTICIRLLWILFNLESNNDYDSLGIINENLSTGKFTNNNALIMQLNRTLMSKFR